MKSLKKKILFILIPIAIIASILLGGTYFINDKYIKSETIYEGVMIEEISLEGLTKDEALDLVKNRKQEEIDEKNIELVYEDYANSISLNDLEYSYNYDEVVQEAYELGRDGGFFERLKTIWSLRSNPRDLKLSHSYNEKVIEEKVTAIEEELMIEPANASIKISGGNIEIAEDVTGRAVVRAELISLIEESIESLETVQIPIEETQAEVTKDFLGQINGVIGSYSTSFAGSASGRVHNIKLSASDFDNLLVMPGEEVSYNGVTGLKTAKNGYREAPVIVRGEYQAGLGGGVCQTSTTLYNALLHADVLITERSPHSIAPYYIARGRDGAVADGYLDLKFKNNHDFPIILKTQVIGTSVEFTVYGDTSVKDYTVKIEPELIATIPHKVQEQKDNSLPVGSRELIQEGRTGYKVRTYKSIIKDGEVLSREEITFDYYRERDSIYKVGTKPVAQRPVEPAETTPPADEGPAEESPDETTTEP